MKFYESISKYYDDIFPLNEMHVSFVKESLINETEINELLDIGCGTGSLSIALSKLGIKVTGIDLDPEMIRLAKLKKGEHITDFKVMDMTKIRQGFEENSFDVICCFGNTLVHILDTQVINRILSDCRKLLKPKGKLLVQILNYDNIINNKIFILPLLDNDKISFNRYYTQAVGSDLLNFKTVLTIKETGQKVENLIQLLPLSKNELAIGLREAGFDQITFFSAFNRTRFHPDSLPLILEAE